MSQSRSHGNQVSTLIFPSDPPPTPSHVDRNFERVSRRCSVHECFPAPCRLPFSRGLKPDGIGKRCSRPSRRHRVLKDLAHEAPQIQNHVLVEDDPPSLLLDGRLLFLDHRLHLVEAASGSLLGPFAHLGVVFAGPLLAGAATADRASAVALGIC